MSEVKSGYETLGSLELPVWELGLIGHHGVLAESYGPWSCGMAGIYAEDVRRTFAERFRNLPSSEAFPSRLLGPDGASFQTANVHPPPKFMVISYTWGRWMRPTREADTILRGGHWKVPANERFTRQDLDTAVQKISGGENAWVDVFCIPQGDGDPEKAVEIGKQGAIFRAASRAAVWLGTGGEDVFIEVCSWVPETTYMVTPSIFQLPTQHLLEIKGRPSGRNDETWRRMRLISRFTDEMPWASSLWTLQESALRPDAAFYTRLGDPILHRETHNPITIRHLMKTMRLIYEELIELFEGPPGQTLFERPDIWGLSDQDGWGLTETDIATLLKAIETVNIISLHGLGTMNAGELLLASTYRFASTPHDRVYGIMGALGVSVTVDYNKDPKLVVDEFLVELHNKVGVEMQAFYAASLPRPTSRSWAMHEESRHLTLLRQKSPLPTPIFTRVTAVGELVVNQVINLSRHGLGELTSRILSKTAFVAADMAPFAALVDNIEQSRKTNYDEMPFVHLSIILSIIASKTSIALVPLGVLSGLERRGWTHAYILLAGKDLHSTVVANPSRNFVRLGLLVTTGAMMANGVTAGEFLIS